MCPRQTPDPIEDKNPNDLWSGALLDRGPVIFSPVPYP